MILSNIEIHKALDDGVLVLIPEPEPRFPETDGECPYQTSAVDLRLGHELLIPKGKRASSIDLSAGKFATLVSEENYDRCELKVEQPYALEPQKFVLGRTLEMVELPIQGGERTLAARVEGRSSYARCGMLVHFTAPTIHAGYKGTITLEIANLGPTKIRLTPGVPICQLIIEEVRGRPFRNDSQFQSQRTPGGV